MKISEWSLKYKYKYNPISSTYMRYVNKEATWDEAKAGCESEGEMLAVFPTLESIIWLDQQLKGPDEGNKSLLVRVHTLCMQSPYRQYTLTEIFDHLTNVILVLLQGKFWLLLQFGFVIASWYPFCFSNHMMLMSKEKYLTH